LFSDFSETAKEQKPCKEEQIMRNIQTIKTAENQQGTKICGGKQIIRNKRTKETNENQ
jgi:hypothetical protein